MSEPGGDWRQRALDDFRQWLDAAAEQPPAHEATEAPDHDLRDLFAEFAALRQEIRLQNREQARAGQTLAAFERRVARTAEDRCLLETLEVRDALVRGRRAAVRLRDRPRLFGWPPRGVAGVVEGYELAIGRVDRMLSRLDVRRVETVGRRFDGRVMQAVEARRVERVGDGLVVEELRSGFVRRDDVLRPADVAVNRLDEER